MSVSSVPATAASTPAVPQFSADDARYRPPTGAGPVLLLNHKRAFRNPKPYLDKAGVSPETLRCEGVPADVPPGVLAIGRLPGMEPVRAVEWSWKGPLSGDEHLLIQFLEAPAFSGLDTLWLDGAPAHEGGVRRRSGRFLAQLAACDRLPRKHLHIAGLAVDVAAIRTLRGWDGLRDLLSWRLSWAEGGRRWSRLLSTLPADNQLRYLEVSWSDLGDAGLDALLTCPLPHLTHLVVRGVGLSDAGGRALLGWPGLDQLAWLDIADNDLSADVVDALRARLGDRLRTL